MSNTKRRRAKRTSKLQKECILNMRRTKQPPFLNRKRGLKARSTFMKLLPHFWRENTKSCNSAQNIGTTSTSRIWKKKYNTFLKPVIIFQVRQLEALKSKKTIDLMKLNDLRQKYKEVQELAMKEKRLAEARAYAKEMQFKRTAAAKKIQEFWRKYRKR
jgi:hypothetical protein